MDVKKIILAWALFAFIFGPPSVARADVKEQAGAVASAARFWMPVAYSDSLTFYADPYSVYKVDDSEWDINIGVVNNQGEYIPDQTKTYRINCITLEVSPNVGWRVNGVLKENRGPLGVRSIRFEKSRLNSTLVMWEAKEYVCGKISSGSNYRWFSSSFRDNQIKGIIDRFWIKDDLVDISPEDQNLRHVSLMYDVMGGDQTELSDVYIKCDSREWLNSAKGYMLDGWDPIVGKNDAIEVLYEKMCTNRFQHVTHRTTPFAMPSPKPASANETVDQAKNGSNMDDAKSKCGALGFQPGTPRFGECVLKLTQ